MCQNWILITVDHHLITTERLKPYWQFMMDGHYKKLFCPQKDMRTPSVMIPTIGHILTSLQNTGTPATALDHVMNLNLDVMPALTRNTSSVWRIMQVFVFIQTCWCWAWSLLFCLCWQWNYSEACNLSMPKLPFSCHTNCGYSLQWHSRVFKKFKINPENKTSAVDWKMT